MAAAIALMAVPASSQAACYSSTPSSQGIADSVLDGDSGLAPELAGLAVSVGGACGVSFDPVIVNRPFDLIDGDGVGIYIDADGNPATGSPTFNGADKVIITAGLTGPDLPPALGTWNGASFSFSPVSILPRVGEAGGRATVDQLGMVASGNIGVRAVALWDGIFDVYGDFAPEPLAAPFSVPVGFSTQAPPPAPAPVPAPVVAPVPAPVTRTLPVAVKTCRVPSVKGMTAARARAKLRAAGCKYAMKAVTSRTREGRVVSVSKPAGAKTSATIVVKVSRGPRRARARAAAAMDRTAIYAAMSERLVAAGRGVEVAAEVGERVEGALPVPGRSAPVEARLGDREDDVPPRDRDEVVLGARPVAADDLDHGVGQRDEIALRGVEEVGQAAAVAVGRKGQAARDAMAGGLDVDAFVTVLHIR